MRHYLMTRSKYPHAGDLLNQSTHRLHRENAGSEKVMCGYYSFYPRHTSVLAYYVFLLAVHKHLVSVRSLSIGNKTFLGIHMCISLWDISLGTVKMQISKVCGEELFPFSMF